MHPIQVDGIVYMSRYMGSTRSVVIFDRAKESIARGSVTHLLEYADLPDVLEVLVVDDEAMVRMVVLEVQEDLGCASLEASDGAVALEILRSDARVHLLITDVGMPNMNGRQVADAARALRPGLKVLFITGCAENAVINHGHLDAGMQIMTKPFMMNAAGAKIKGMLDGIDDAPSDAG